MSETTTSGVMAALGHYFARGWQVSRVPARGRFPTHTGWQNDRLSWPDIVATWEADPDANVAILTGTPSKMWALDVDPRHGGHLQLAALAAEHGPLPVTYMQRTGRGGFHMLWTLPVGKEVRNSQAGTRLPTGLDVRGTGGQIIAAPSVSEFGEYVTLCGYDFPTVEAPDWLFSMVEKLPEPERVKTPAVDLSTLGAGERTRLGAYARAAIGAELERLRTAVPGTHNDTGHAVACNLHEWVNTPWAGLDEATAWGAFEAMCLAADSEFRWISEIWAKARRRVEGKGRPLPSLPSVGFDPGPMHYGVSNGNGHNSSVGAVVPHFEPIPHGASGGLRLPEEFWAARGVLGHIRQVAHSRGVSGDVVFYSVLARLAALWPHQVGLDTGVAGKASAACFVAVVGPSGVGKSSGVSVAANLLATPPWLLGSFADDRPLGTGEGVAEAYMGTEFRPVMAADGSPAMLSNGGPKVEKVRAQVRHNVLLHADEGEAIARMLERTGATIGETLRRAWTGAALGQANGREETTRVIPAGGYSLGLVVGFQRETAQPLLADSAAGTPQRFLWCWALDETVPDVAPVAPGPLPHVLAGSGDDLEWLVGTADLREVEYAASIRARLRVDHARRARGEAALAEMDAHKPLTLVKVSALLARLDGRAEVTEADWALAEVVWATSCRVRDHLLAFGAGLRRDAAMAKSAAYATQEGQAEAARLSVRAGAELAAVERVAGKVLADVKAAEGGLTLRAARHLRASRDRHLFDAAVERLAEAGSVRVVDGRVEPAG